MKKIFSVMIVTAAFLGCGHEEKPGPSLTLSGTGDGDGGADETGESVCGDAIVSGNEDCDGVGMTCSAAGYGGSGNVTCDPMDCIYDYSQCEGAADDTGGDGGNTCDPDDAQFECHGVGYPIYCLQGTSSCGIVPLGQTKKYLCIGEGQETTSDAYGIDLPGVCSQFAGLGFDYNEFDPTQNPDATPTHTMLADKCRATCEENVMSGVFPATLSNGSGTWVLTQAQCYFGHQMPHFFTGNDYPNNPGGNGWNASWSDAADKCGFDYNQELAEWFEVVTNSNGDPVNCEGEVVCAPASCDRYSPDLDFDSRSGTNMYSHIEMDWLSTLDPWSAQECDSGKYIWMTAGSGKFKGLGTGSAYYELGFRNDDQLISMWSYNPNTYAATSAVYPVTSEIELADAYMNLVSMPSSALYIAVKFKRSRTNYTMYIRIS